MRPSLRRLASRILADVRTTLWRFAFAYPTPKVVETVKAIEAAFVRMAEPLIDAPSPMVRRHRRALLVDRMTAADREALCTHFRMQSAFAMVANRTTGKIILLDEAEA